MQLHQHQQQQANGSDDQDHQEPEEEVQQRVLEPLQPHLQLLPVELLDVQHASALVSWPQATYTLREHENDDEQVAYQLQVHYRVSYTLQVQPVPLGPPTAEEPVEQLLSRVPGAVVDSAWKDVLTLEEAPAEAHKVGSLRAGRFYAVRLRGHVYAELDSGPVFFNDTFTSDVVAFRTLPCAPGQMQAPSLARRDRTLLKLKWNLPDETGGEVITQYQLKVKPLPPSAVGSPPDEEGFATIYEGPGEGPPTAKDRTHFTLKLLGPGQKYSFRIRCFNPLGVGNWSLSSTFTTAPSVPSQPDPPRLVTSTPDSVTLAWQPPPDNGSAITFYLLEMDDGCGGEFHHVHTGQAEPCSAVVEKLQSGLHYRVRLRAENSEGRSQWSPIQPISTAASLPSCPVGLKLGQTTRSTVSLSWSPPADDGGSDVQEYEVQLLPVSKIAVADLGGSDWLSIYQGSGLSTSWNSLRAGCKYQLRVACRNTVGYSQYSIPVTFVTAPDVPLPPPRPSALIESRALFINLQPPPHDGGSAVTQYSVLMRCSPGAAAAAASPSEPQPFTSTEWTEKWRGEYKGAAVPVLNLLPGTVYEFRAAAWNNFGSSMHSEIGSATTLPAEPLPPQAPQLVSAAGSSLVVSWREPYGQGSPVTKYKLSYACLGPVGGANSRGHSRSSSSAALLLAGNGHAEPGHAPESGDDTGSVSSSSGMGSSSGPAVDKLRWEQAYHGPDLSAAAKQLLPAHRYLLRVRASNEIGASHWSQPLAAITAAAAPCQPVQLAASAEGSRSIAVSWHPPEVDNGSPVTSYHLEVQAAGGAAGAGWAMVWQGRELGHTVDELLPGRKYSWRVRAVNGCGVGPWAEAPPVSTAPSVPGPPGKPSTSKVTATSAKLKWGIPLEDHGAAVKTYHVQLRQLPSEPAAAAGRVASSSNSGEEEEEGSAGGSCGADDWQEVYAGPLLDTTATRLQPGTRYELRVAAANIVGLGRWSPAVELATPLRPPPAPTALSAEPCEDESQLGSVAVSWQQTEPGPDSAAAVSVIVEALGSGSKEAAARATVHVADGTGSSAVLQVLRPGGSYSIRVRAVGAGSTGHSAWCEGVSVALPAPLVDPAAAVEAQAGPAAEGAGKRSGKGKGGKGAAGKATAKGVGAAAEGEVQQRSGGRRGNKAVIVDVMKGVGKKVPVQKPLSARVWLKAKKAQKHPLFWPILAVLAIAVWVYVQFVLPWLREAGVM